MFIDEQGILTGSVARELAQEFGVESAIFERDYLLNALVWAKKGDVAAAYRRYIADCRTNAETIRKIIESYFGEWLRPISQNPSKPALKVLDFLRLWPRRPSLSQCHAGSKLCRNGHSRRCGEFQSR